MPRLAGKPNKRLQTCHPRLTRLSTSARLAGIPGVFGAASTANRQSASYQGFGESAQTQSFKRQFTLAPEHNKVLAVTETTQQGNGSQSQQNHTLHWDASGKLQGNGHIHFQRDAAGRVQQTLGQHNDTTTYITNALGQRIRKQTGSGAKRHITDTVYGEETIAPGLQSFALGHYEHKQTAQGTAPTLTSEYIYIPTPMGPMPIAAEINGRLYAIHTDQLNTPRQLTDENGQEVWQWAISGFGEVEPTTAQTGWIRARNGSAGQISNTLPVTFNLRFPGQQFDEETGLHYNHHRYYDPYLTVGYTEADPLGLNAGWNRFVYAEGDAINGFDPNGLEAEVCFYRGGSGEWPHVFTCVDDDCAGWYPSPSKGDKRKSHGKSMFSSDGAYVKDNDIKEASYCRKADGCERDILKQCLLQCRENPPPYYNFLTNNCASAAHKCETKCSIESCENNSFRKIIRVIFS